MDQIAHTPVQVLAVDVHEVHDALVASLRRTLRALVHSGSGPVYSAAEQVGARDEARALLAYIDGTNR